MPGIVREQDVTAFFDSFVACFATFDGARVAELYLAPTIALRRDGSVQCLASRTEIAAFFQTALDGYRARQVAICRYGALDVQPLGGRAALGTVTWDLLAADSGVVMTWRQSYTLVAMPEGLRVMASVTHG